MAVDSTHDVYSGREIGFKTRWTLLSLAYWPGLPGESATVVCSWSTGRDGLSMNCSPMYLPERDNAIHVKLTYVYQLKTKLSNLANGWRADTYFE